MFFDFVSASVVTSAWAIVVFAGSILAIWNKIKDWIPKKITFIDDEGIVRSFVLWTKDVNASNVSNTAVDLFYKKKGITRLSDFVRGQLLTYTNPTEPHGLVVWVFGLCQKLCFWQRPAVLPIPPAKPEGGNGQVTMVAPPVQVK